MEGNRIGNCNSDVSGNSSPSPNKAAGLEDDPCTGFPILPRLET